MTTSPFEAVLAWDEPLGLAPRGTVIVLPGRGERPGVYERFGRRLAADSYRVRVVRDATEDVDEVARRISALLAAPYTVGPVVLAGSDTGALMALRTLLTGADVAGVVLAGLPDPDRETAVAEDAEPELRASCPTHQKLLADSERGLFVAGTLTTARIPSELRDPVDLTGVSVPVLAVHGANDQVSPLAHAVRRYSDLPRVQLAAIEDGRHDVLNAAHHRTVAATVVLWLEQLRLGANAGPIARTVDLASFTETRELSPT
ncbi:alpha/beta hydrolase [Pseudonocardia spinosispora]|uniref:alpha/beta hydrolase n=1 Tax=Pseudonocardia spinosispora TaxID=103441 RepID=UPI00041E1028|nr:alpha/beta fold hydrolase [Pseudonocardia spinosispora]